MADPYFRSLPLFPTYTFGDAAIDGLVPACRVESWEAFMEHMRSPDHNRAKDGFMYRGQAGHNWHLSSTLARMFDGGAVPGQHQENLLAQFRLSMRGRGLDCSKLDDGELWAFGQHHGLRTPLIDWTKSPYVALFFAFDEPDIAEVENPSRAVFCLNRASILANDNLAQMLFEPTHHENARLVNQAGLFVITPSGKDNLVSAILNELTENEVINPDDPMDVARHINKIHIPNANRGECLAALLKMNIHHANLFPDPGGASKYCNDWLARLIDEEKRDAAEARALEAAGGQALDEPETKQLADGEISTDAIAVLLRNTVRDDTLFPPSVLVGWASKIITRYERTADTDWPDRPSAKLRLKIAFRRFLKSNSVNDAVAETGARRLVEFFEANWKAANAS